MKELDDLIQKIRTDIIRDEAQKVFREHNDAPNRDMDNWLEAEKRILALLEDLEKQFSPAK